MSTVTYTFPASAPAALAGKTVTGGNFCRRPINGKVTDVCDFGPQSCLGGQNLVCIIAGKPELEAAFAAHNARLAAEREKEIADRAAFDATLEGQRALLVTAEYNSYSPEYFPGSKAWMKNKADRDALSDFDAKHPEIIAAINVARKAKQAADYDALSDFVKMGS